MTKYGIDSLYWRGRFLYFKSLVLEGKPLTPLMAIKPHHWHEKLFYVEWIDGVTSAECYNIERAKQHASDIAIAELNKSPVEMAI